MTLLYIVLAAFAAWILRGWLIKPKRASPPPSSQKSGSSTNSQRLGRVGEEKAIDKDDWEGSFWEVSEPLPAKARLRIKYIDGAGKKSDRIVDVRQFGSMGESALLIGHCNMRNATRTFRTDRMEFCVDEETGEVINDVRAYLQKRYEESPDKTKDVLLDSEFDVLRILLYVGKADGQLRAPEKEVIRDTCIAITNDSRLTDKNIEDLLADMDIPTLQAFKLAVGRILKREPEVQVIVLSAAEKMVATQKSIHPAEQEALDYMKKRFMVNGASST